MLGTLEALIRLHELEVVRNSGKADKRTQLEEDRCKQELPPELVDRHEYLFSRYGASALTPIKNGCCSGCYVQMPSSRNNKLENGVYVCEQCGRLLYDESRVFDLLRA